MSWAWAGYALKYQVSIRNWPNSLVEKAIWPKKGFKLSRIEDATIRRMVRAVERKMGFRWQPWADEDVEEQKDNEDEHDDSEEEDGERQVNREKGKDDGEEEDEDEGDDDMPVVEIVPWTDGELKYQHSAHALLLTLLSRGEIPSRRTHGLDPSDHERKRHCARSARPGGKPPQEGGEEERARAEQRAEEGA